MFRNTCLLLPLLVFLLPSVARSQSFFDYFLQPDYIQGGTLLRIEEKQMFNGEETPGRVSTSSMVALNLGVGWNFPLFSPAPEMSIGISPALIGTAPFLSTGSAGNKGNRYPAAWEFIGLYGSVPVLLTFKYGNDATWRGKLKYGFSAGVGYQQSWILGIDDTRGAPVVMAEVNADVGKLVKLRFTHVVGGYSLPDGMHASMSTIDLAVTPAFK